MAVAEKINAATDTVMSKLLESNKDGGTALEMVKKTNSMIGHSTDFSTQISELNQSIAQMMQEQSAVSAEISSTMHQIQNSNNEIELAVEQTAERNSQIRGIGTFISDEANIFKT
ncbi:MAG: methyl-accepting chemotaxis protein [Methylophaga nitratireducenticrescens]|nr:MAG: methyl-accepting chemotaxis protein [Methylophaga nitratireducenticrescens]